MIVTRRQAYLLHLPCKSVFINATFDSKPVGGRGKVAVVSKTEGWQVE